MIKRAWGRVLLPFIFMLLFLPIVSSASNLTDIKIIKTESYLKIDFVFDSEVSVYSTQTDISMENFFLNFKDSKSSLSSKSFDVGISPVFKIEIDSEKPLKVSLRMIFPRLPEIKKDGNVISLNFKRYEKKADFVFTDTDLGFAANYIAEMMGISIIVDQQVKKIPVSLNLRNASPEDAFIDILKTHGKLGYVILPDQTLYVSSTAKLLERFGDKILMWKIYDFSEYSFVVKKFIVGILKDLIDSLKKPDEDYIFIPIPKENDKVELKNVADITTQGGFIMDVEKLEDYFSELYNYKTLEEFIK
ncbi:MAG: hypothetical protein J7K69_01290, partial [Thermotogae bacterium]|nr:hypothetical protein [Thermotogota bacterium]